VQVILKAGPRCCKARLARWWGRIFFQVPLTAALSTINLRSVPGEGGLCFGF